MNNILLTIDVEDWFQVENFKSSIPFLSWDSKELRVEQNTYRLLDLFDSSINEHQIPQGQVTVISKSIENPGFKIRATFFILGWIAERLPHLVREIEKRGHEVASHGYDHILCSDLAEDKMKKDLTRSKKLLEDLIGRQVYGYRAPSFAIDDDVLKIIADCGYLYDSSYNSFGYHGRYGKISLPENNGTGIARPVTEAFFEIPISNLCFRRPFRRRNTDSKIVLPWGGGGYFRLLPESIFRSGVRSILKKQPAYLFYMHPWEIDTEQPRVENAALFYRFRHYTNLDKTEARLKKFIQSFNDCCFITCKQYLDSVLTDHEGSQAKRKSMG